MGNYPSSHKVRGPMSRAQSPRCRIEGPRFRVQGPWPKVQDPLFTVEGQRFQGPGRGFQGPGSRVQYFESSFKAQIGIPHGQRPPPLVGCHSGEKPLGPGIQGRSARARDQGPVSSMHAHRALSSSRKGSRFQGSRVQLQGFKGTGSRVPGSRFLGARVPGFQGLQVPGLQGSWVGFQGSRYIVQARVEQVG